MKNALLRDGQAQCWLSFAEPIVVLETFDPCEVMATIQAVEERVSAERWYAVGFISYEAAPAFDEAFVVRYSAGFPLVRFGLFDSPVVLDELPPGFCSGGNGPSGGEWQLENSSHRYANKIETIKAHLRDGDSYQVNYTIRQHRRLPEDPRILFANMAADAAYAAYIECEDFTICSASPELFFDLDGDRLTSRPMKGTAPRGDTPEEDLRLAEWLHTSEKNRAENLMIVDMIRNDIGRIALPGSIAVEDLFKVETHPTVLQMTSTVRATTRSSVSEIFRALFPCASITGAPKINTMRIIADLEDGPRRLYTGAVGVIGPDRKARFSVAIRTAIVDNRCRQVEYGTGGGIVWDSLPEEELAECRMKTRVVDSVDGATSFDLFETLLWTGKEFYLLERHLTRLGESAAYFGFASSPGKIREYLQNLVSKLPETPCRVRVFLSEGGAFRYDRVLLEEENACVWRVGIAKYPVDESLVWLRHKTTLRGVYEQARVRCSHLDDVLLWNRDGLLTESTIANVAVRIEDRLCTPPLSCGLLPGTFRAEMIDAGELVEKEIPMGDLSVDSEIYLLNSVRRWIPAQLDAGSGEAQMTLGRYTKNS